MRDVFYTILVVWIVWRIANTYSSYSVKRHQHTGDSFNRDNSEKDKTTIKYSPPVTNKINDNEGEYVDFEEIK